jgi:hypothetical protein
VEYVDTAMYGFWGEGHTWPFEDKRNPFPDYATAEATWVRMFEKQLAHWKKTPLTTNTQPDFSRVGNFELLERTVRSHNWLRTDTIFIENEQIEALSNRPPWIGVAVEVPNSDGSPQSLHVDEGGTLTDNVIGHVRDVGRLLLLTVELASHSRRPAATLLREISRCREQPGALDRLSRQTLLDLDL